MDSLSRSGSAADRASRRWLTDQTLMRLRQAAAAVWTFVILLLCWMPKRVVEEVEEGSGWFHIPYFDKIVHAGIFFVFAILWLHARRARGPVGYAWVTVAGLLLAVVSELGQTMSWVGRDASVGDTLTDWAGLAVGLVLAPYVEPRLAALEAKLFSPWKAPVSTDEPRAGSGEARSQSARSGVEEGAS